MLRSIVHRGPDDQGEYMDAQAAIGMRRLSIIDLAGGHQPITNETGDLWIVFNGEIFNHAQIRVALEAAGHRYTTRSDTETILHAYEQYGRDCVNHLRGMFAFVIWDRKRKTVFAARDRLGIKPFYYHWNGRLFAFGSEIKTLFEHPEISPRLHAPGVAAHLSFGFSSGEQTLFAGVQKLMPGHVLEMDWSGEMPTLEIRQYWDPPRPAQLEDPYSEKEWIEECRRRIEESVQLRLMSDVPLGMFLSGGVDSSLIAAMMTRMVSGKVKTFSVGYEESAYSELGYARTVSEKLGTDHHEVKLSCGRFFELMPQLIWHEDEPVAWPSSVSLHEVSKLASQHVKVVLTGEGSDELFGGYERYGHHLWNTAWSKRYGVVPESVRTWIRSRIESSSLLSGDLRRKIQHTFVGRSASVEALFWDNFYGAFGGEELRELLLQPSSPYAEVRKFWDNGPHPSLLAQMLYTDQKTYLVELLMKQDQMSMACSIESRVPFLDHPLVEFASRIPDAMKIRNGTGKYILKKVAEPYLPHDIVYRKKMGFPTPLKQWLRQPSSAPIYDYLCEEGGLLAQCVRREPLQRMLQLNRAGQVDATDRIWRLLNLQIWGDLYITGRKDRLETGVLSPAGTVPSA